MPGVEVPDPDEVREKASDSFTRIVALAVGVYAAALAVASLGGNNAVENMLLGQQRAGNQWSYFQARVVRENLYLLEAEKFDLELEVRGRAMPDADRRRVESLRDKYRTKAEAYEREKEGVLAEVRREEAGRDVALRRDPYYDAARVSLEVAIVLASVAILSGRRWVFAASLVAAAVGALLMVNGYWLLVTVPGVE